MKIRVYYEDTDAGGIVYHSNYLNFCERARSELFFSAGRSPVLSGGFFVVKKIEANYHKSAKLGDLLEVKTTLLGTRSASFSMLQEVVREDMLLFSMKIQLAFIDFEGNVAKIPDEDLAFLETIF
jgi:acyl-CoA thioester hydrolase